MRARLIGPVLAAFVVAGSGAASAQGMSTSTGPANGAGTSQPSAPKTTGPLDGGAPGTLGGTTGSIGPTAVETGNARGGTTAAVPTGPATARTPVLESPARQ